MISATICFIIATRFLITTIPKKFLPSIIIYGTRTRWPQRKPGKPGNPETGIKPITAHIAKINLRIINLLSTSTFRLLNYTPDPAIIAIKMCIRVIMHIFQHSPFGLFFPGWIFTINQVLANNVMFYLLRTGHW